MPATSSRKTAKRTWSRLEGAALVAALALRVAPARALEYREDFDAPGKPQAPAGLAWTYRAELCPVKKWRSIIPGVGYAYLSVKRSRLENPGDNAGTWLFQTLTVGPVTPGHRFVMRARDAAIPGVASMIFTHRQNGTIDEIDIEISADDTYAAGTGHPVGPAGGWTDVRFNTYARADARTLVPSRRMQKPVTDARGGKVSLRDSAFHIFAFEWRRASVRFLIDGVEQAVIDDVVPQGSADLVLGLRQMPWAGQADWDGCRTMLIDWVAIESLDND